MSIVIAGAAAIAWRVGFFGFENRAALAAAIERARTMPFVAPLFVATYAVAAASLLGSRAFTRLFRLRLVPVIPLALLNAGAAISGISWRDFAVATTLGIVPITVIYTVSASKLVAGVAGSGTQALRTALISAGVLIVLTFLPALVRSLRKTV